MDILKSLAIIGILTILCYFIMVSLLDKPLRTNGILKQEQMVNNESPITNTLQLLPAELKEPVAPVNLSSKSPMASNEDLFEKTADFDSDVTNINQFYKNNPELFRNTTQVHVPDVASWDEQGNFMHQTRVGEKVNDDIQGYNFEKEGAPLV